MKKRKLNYRFHNPNTAEATTAYLLKVLLEVNAAKVERVIQEKVLEPGKEREAFADLKSEIPVQQ